MQLAFLNTHLSKSARRKAEKLMSNYKNLEAIIESKRMDLSAKLTVNYQTSESQRGNQFHSEVERQVLLSDDIKDYIITKNKLDLVYHSLKPEQRTIWEERYIMGRYDTDVYYDMEISDRKYYRLKREMIAVVADAFNLIVSE